MNVALHVRAWVEIQSLRPIVDMIASRPPCEGVGRNMAIIIGSTKDKDVALHVRAWVEIKPMRVRLRTLRSRPPCEGVGRNGLC